MSNIFCKTTDWFDTFVYNEAYQMSLTFLVLVNLV